MDDKWFKAQQKRVGVTAEDIAKKMGRDRSAVSHIYTGQRRMSLEWAQVFSDVLEVPLDEVLKRAGVLSENPAREIAVGLADGDVVPWKPMGGGDRSATDAVAGHFGGGKPGVDVWIVSSGAMQLGGYMPGDNLLVDTNQSEMCRAGDVVLAQKYDWKTGNATTLLRRFEPPVLVPASADLAEQRVFVVDGDNVLIKGKVVASWRG